MKTLFWYFVTICSIGHVALTAQQRKTPTFKTKTETEYFLTLKAENAAVSVGEDAKPLWFSFPGSRACPIKVKNQAWEEGFKGYTTLTLEIEQIQSMKTNTYLTWFKKFNRTAR